MAVFSIPVSPALVIKSKQNKADQNPAPRRNYKQIGLNRLWRRRPVTLKCNRSPEASQSHMKPTVFLLYVAFPIMGATSAKPQVEHFGIHTCYTATFSRMPRANFDAEVVLDFAWYFTQNKTDDNQFTSRSLCVAM